MEEGERETWGALGSAGVRRERERGRKREREGGREGQGQREEGRERGMRDGKSHHTREGEHCRNRRSRIRIRKR